MPTLLKKTFNFMEKQTNLLEAIKASSAIQRGKNESTLNFLTRSLEISAGLQRTVPDPGEDCVKAAIQARSTESKAKSLAATATATAKARQAIKAIPPRPSTSYPQAGRIARQIAAQASARPELAFVPDTTLIQNAIHPLANDSGRSAAIAELERRGYSVASNGNVTLNHKAK
jgi:hypothetical protein